MTSGKSQKQRKYYDVKFFTPTGHFVGEAKVDGNQYKSIKEVREWIRDRAGDDTANYCRIFEVF